MILRELCNKEVLTVWIAAWHLTQTSLKRQAQNKASCVECRIGCINYVLSDCCEKLI